MDNTPQDRVSLQRFWNDHALANSPNWHAYRSTHMMFVEQDTELVLWRHTTQGPVILEVLKVFSVSLGFQGGLLIGLEDSLGRRHTVTATPRELFGGVFLWTPAFAEIRYVPRDFANPESPRFLSLGLCAKMHSRFEQPVPGHRYLLPLEKFRTLHPNIL